jgi:hypothetical protein
MNFGSRWWKERDVKVGSCIGCHVVAVGYFHIDGFLVLF